MNNPLVSVIIPVYNASNYIIRTSENLISQTLDDIEIIYVENGSLDDSSSLAAREANQYRQVKFYNEPTPGVSAARNLGLEMAKGQYVMFMDDDDVQSDDIARCLFKAIEGYDMSICGCQILENGSVTYSTHNDLSRVIDGFTAIKGMIEEDKSLRYIWNKMFRRDIIEKYHIRFTEGVHYYEDVLFMVEYLMHCDNIRQVPDIHYYFNRTGSISQKLIVKNGKPTERALTAVDGYLGILDQIESLNNFELNDYVKDKIIGMELDLIEKMLDNINYHDYRFSKFRRNARRTLKWGYKPKNDREEYLYKKLKSYVRFGTTKRA